MAVGTCLDCGKRLVDHRSTRCWPCAMVEVGRQRRGADNPSWKGDGALKRTKRARAMVVMPIEGLCQVDGCEAPAEEHHHLDGDVGNNAVENLMLMCMDHHRRMHAAMRPRDERGRFIPFAYRATA